MTHTEAKGIAFCSLWRADGGKINLTHRADSSVEAGEELLIGINHFEKEHGFMLAPDFSKVIKSTGPTGPGDPSAPRTDPAPAPTDRNGDNMIPATAARDLGLVKYKPKAHELNPGDVYEIEVNEYKAGPAMIEFHSTDSKYPVLKHNVGIPGLKEKFDTIFNGWEPADTNDTVVPMPGGSVILKVIGSDTLTSAGNPYHNLNGMRRG